ncbi:oligosaccharide flippase family protein [Nocardioides sp. SYSU DS0663]|uniref:oligosaccharide flippase family protein n=1 Tax=Nocardioides sp. SYSU DS0663 TaxID=3416445 RepID=UPI003F4B595D
MSGVVSTPTGGAPASSGAARTAGLGRDSGRTVIGTAVTTLCNFVLLAAIARGLGNSAVGLFSIAFALRAILVLVCGLGMRVALTKFVAGHRARGDGEGLRGSVLLGVALPTVCATVLGGALALAAGPLARELFDNAALVVPLRLVALSLPFAVLMDTSLAATQGFSSMRAYAGIGLTLEPLLRLGLVVAAIAAGAGLDAVTASLPVASAVASMAAVVALRRTMRRVSPGVRVPWGELLRFASVSWVASLATQGLLWADVLILGVLASAEDVGVYQVATRIVLAAMLMITPLTTAMAPRVAHAHELGDRRGLSERYLGVVRWTWRLTVPLLVGVVVVPGAALSAFGGDFEAGIVVIHVLAVGAVIEALAAPSAVVLNQTGHNRLNMIINVSALVTNVVLNIVLVPRIGIVGAAIAWSVVLLVPGLVRIVAVRRLAVDRWPFGRPQAVSLAGAALGGLAVLAVDDLLPSAWALRLLLAGLIVLACYLAVVLPFGLTRTERRQLRYRGQMLKRTAATRLPVLRKLRNRWHVRSLTLGSARIEIEQLISPFRYDVLARVDIFRLIRDHPVPVERDFPAFLELANASRYRLWFDEVLSDVLALRGAPPSVRDKVFEQMVMRGVQLYRSVERHGFDRRHPVTVALVPAGVSVGGRALAEDRWIPMDGCHRLALMYLSGRRCIESSDYVIDPLDQRLYHTARMARAERLAREELLGFFAAGLAEPDAGAPPIGSWEELLDRLRNPANRDPLEAWPEAAWLSRGSGEGQDAESGPDWLEVDEPGEQRPVVG